MGETAPEEHGRFDYSAIVDRPKLSWPNGARVAVWVIPNLEHFHFNKPSASLNPGLAALQPDVLNYAWRDYGARVTGITLSTEQLAVSRQRAEEAGVADRVTFELMDYRNWTRPVDRIVSVGMFEHVGVAHYGQFFRIVRNALREDGVALIHAIGRMDGPGGTNPWIKRYIFPGAYCPALSEVLPGIERAGLLATASSRPMRAIIEAYLKVALFRA